MVSIRPIMSTASNRILKPAIPRKSLKPAGTSKKLKDMGGPDPQAEAKTAATVSAAAGAASELPPANKKEMERIRTAKTVNNLFIRASFSISWIAHLLNKPQHFTERYKHAVVTYIIS